MMHYLDLSGTWFLGWSDGQRNAFPDPRGDDADPRGLVSATVPGSVHLDLVAAGLLVDPYGGTGCLAARWVEENLWYYRRVFDAPEDAARVWLVFEALDLGARIHLNGSLVASHANVFRPCRIDVTDHLRPGANLLVVEIESGLFHAGDKPAGGYAKHRDVELHKRHWLRKPQFQFLWDWSSRLINVGIPGAVRLEWTAEPVRVDDVVFLCDTDPGLTRATVTVKAFVENLGDAPVTCVLRAAVGELGELGEVSVAESAPPGASVLQGVIHVDAPPLWWPAGVGDQPLFDAQATVSVDGIDIGSRSRRVGFRHVVFDQSPASDGAGTRFTLVVNGRPVFCKGGNFVPADMLYARCDRDRYEKLVDLALEANFNFLRVWGGGLYESDDFYDLCDERGVLVWQDFIYACSRYPTTDQVFFDDICAEAVHQVRRLAHHTSLVAWCGNNENEWGAWDWGYTRGTVLPDHAFFHLTLPRIMAREDPGRWYQPSSPWSPDGSHPNRDEVGDQHPWSVGFANSDFRDYRRMISRFANEGGVLGPTSMPTMRQCLTGGPEEVGSFAWRLHDNTNGPHADAMLQTWLGLDPYALSVEEYTYWGGLLQGEGLREYCEAFRRRMFDSAAAVFWMYNDCWPATRSWTIVDHGLRRTPSFAPVRRALAPVGLAVAEEGDDVVIVAVNDTADRIDATLRFGLLALAGPPVLESTSTVTIEPNAATVVGSFPARSWTDHAATFAFGELSADGRVFARARLVLPLFKDVPWPEGARPTVRLDAGEAVFESDCFCWGVCLDLDGEAGYADNFFDVWPGVPHRVRWDRSEPPNILYVGNELAGRRASQEASSR